MFKEVSSKPYIFTLYSGLLLIFSSVEISKVLLIFSSDEEIVH